MDKIRDLYEFLNNNSYLANKISLMDEEDFLNDESAINAGYSLVNSAIEKIANLDIISLFLDEKLNIRRKEMESLDGYLMNSYKEVNGYLVYDYLKEEYQALLKSLEEILSI